MRNDELNHVAQALEARELHIVEPEDQPASVHVVPPESRVQQPLVVFRGYQGKGPVQELQEKRGSLHSEPSVFSKNPRLSGSVNQLKTLVTRTF